MRCSEIIQKLEELSPSSFAESWDNVGLLAGRRDREVTKVYLALDATDEVIAEAVRIGAQMLLTHHPLIFTAMKRVTAEDFIGRRVAKLLRHDISYYAMHTNFDLMGMADAAADEMGLRNRQVLAITYEDEIAKEGIGRFGTLPSIMSLLECAEYVKKVFHVENVRVFGDPEAEMEYAAVSPGSAKSVIKSAIALGADVLISGDVDHHEGIDCVAQGMNVIDAGHYGMEKIFMPYMEEFFHRELPQIETVTAPEKNPFWTI